MPPEIRPLSESAVGRFVDELYLPFAREMAEIDAYNALADVETVRARTREYRREQLADGDVRIRVAVDGNGGDGNDVEDGDGRTGDVGELVGYVAAEIDASPPVFARGPTLAVEELYVVSGARGSGLADRLLDRVTEWGRERGCERVGLSVNADNERARSFYERRGFEPRRLKLDHPL
jgi:ribosomal protein S18 acetylase RimI-like enzyme